MNFVVQVADYFQKGGLVMYPLLLCSVVMLIIGIERYLFYKTADSGSEFTEKFCRFLEEKDWQGAYTLASSAHGEAAALVALTMERSQNNIERIDSFVTVRAERAIDRLEQYLSYLSVIVTLSPMLGLLGTITGMMSSFNALDMRTENPLAVTAGVAEALITTVAGLCIALVTICIHTYFARRLKQATLNIEESSNVLLEVIHQKQGE